MYHYMTAERVCSNFQQQLLKPRLKATGATDSQDYGNKHLHPNDLHKHDPYG